VKQFGKTVDTLPPVDPAHPIVNMNEGMIPDEPDAFEDEKRKKRLEVYENMRAIKGTLGLR
jgi:hypothetical protein